MYIKEQKKKKEKDHKDSTVAKPFLRTLQFTTSSSL